MNIILLTVLVGLIVNSQIHVDCQRDDVLITDLCSNGCTCERNTGTPWMAVTYYCQMRNFTDFETDLLALPPFAENMVLSWNHFKYAPQLKSDFLRLLDLMGNEIIQLDEKNFASLPLLLDLNLSWNRITIISLNAFEGLTNLRMLNLGGNQLTTLSSNVFSHLPHIEHLILSHNDHLNQTLESSDVDLFVSLGVATVLKTIELNNCSLSSIDLSQGVDLQEIQLRTNDFTSVPNIPKNAVTLDMSRNPFTRIGGNFLPLLPDLETLILEDMPRLMAIDDYAFDDLPKLKNLNIQNCWNLTYFSALAFGDEEHLKKTELNLVHLNLQGGFLTTLNESLLPVFSKIDRIELFGNPFICDCQVEWIKELKETNAMCTVPKSLRGQLISAVDEDRMECRRWPSWLVRTLNGLLVLLLLILCAAAIWLVVMGLRPSRRDVLQKIGAQSPYARVTIQPNQAEDH